MKIIDVTRKTSGHTALSLRFGITYSKYQIEELEGLFRHIYRLDTAANKLNKQRAYGPLIALSKQTAESVRESVA